jgi:uncharacterized protein YchJ
MSELLNIPTDQIEELIKLLPETNTPKIIPVYVEPSADINFCFQNVEKQVDNFGGLQIFGWKIWKHNFMIEAEFHSIWKNKSDELVDITPQIDNAKQILFIQDNKTKYNGQQIDNIRLRTINNKLVDDYIELAKAKYALMNRGERANQNGLVELEEKEAKIYGVINKMMVFIYEMLKQNNTRNSQCFCGQKRKYKHCHGKDLISNLKNIINK